MPLVKVEKADVAEKLRMGPVGIGEHHSKTTAREFLKLLMDLGDVKILFLEIPAMKGKPGNLQQTVLDQCLAKATLAKTGGDWEQAHTALNPIDTSCSPNNPIKFSELIVHAWKHNVRVVFADKLMNNPASDYGMQIRNEFVEKVFEHAAPLCGNTLAAGCVILFGAEHFAPLNEGDSKIGDNINRMFCWADLSE